MLASLLLLVSLQLLASLLLFMSLMQLASLLLLVSLMLLGSLQFLWTLLLLASLLFGEVPAASGVSALDGSPYCSLCPCSCYRPYCC